MNYLLGIILFAVSIVMVIFGAQNTQTVELNFLTYQSGSVSLSLVIVLATLGGVVLASLVGVLSGVRRSMRERTVRRKLEKENRELQQRLLILDRDNAKMRAALQMQARASAATSAVTGEQKPSSK